MDLTLPPQENSFTAENTTLRRELNDFPENEKTNLLDGSSSFGNLINETISDPATELTEDDIFRMKTLRFQLVSLNYNLKFF